MIDFTGNNFLALKPRRSQEIEQIEETLLRLSQLACEYPHVCELDINPLMISETTGEAVAVDARIRIAK